MSRATMSRRRAVGGIVSKQRYSITVEYRPEASTFYPWRYHVSRVNRGAAGETIRAVESAGTRYRLSALLAARDAARRDARALRLKSRPYHREVMR